jgi:hypothetical protein
MEKLKLDILSSLGATFVLTPFTMLFFTFLIDCDPFKQGLFASACAFIWFVAGRQHLRNDELKLMAIQHELEIEELRRQLGS